MCRNAELHFCFLDSQTQSPQNITIQWDKGRIEPNHVFLWWIRWQGRFLSALKASLFWGCENSLRGYFRILIPAKVDFTITDRFIQELLYSKAVFATKQKLLFFKTDRGIIFLVLMPPDLRSDISGSQRIQWSHEEWISYFADYSSGIGKVHYRVANSLPMQQATPRASLEDLLH